MSIAEGSERSLFTSESVTEGHPDKVCDQISDAVVDASLRRDPRARVACEASIKSDDDRDWVAVFGEATPLPPSDEVDRLVRDVLTDIGYTDRAYGTNADTAEVQVMLTGQSADIAAGVDRSLEARSGQVGDELSTGAGDQGMMFGYACDESPELMPLPIMLAHRLVRRLSEVRKDGTLSWLRPDGKSQVTVEYEGSKPVRVDTVVISTQHAPEISNDEITAQIIEHVIQPIIEPSLRDAATRLLVNPSGRFVIGGPRGDSGLTGRKIIVDTYGGMARHGGGAFSGKDPTKVDRSASYAARWVAKNVVAAGLAGRCELRLAYAIGVAEPVSVSVETFGSETVPVATIERAVRSCFDLRPNAIISALDLRRPIFRTSMNYGHFGHLDRNVPWEQTDRADALRQQAGATAATSAAR
ncbi:MAG: methionine adenosyltransferase [Acidimicrobiales bacterium]|nr:methionine adenosyltransferase [Acidimicrobiales bacterium]MBO0887254.1 methionine adenosyltransferase [Acidimicrobiales bacterium]